MLIGWSHIRSLGERHVFPVGWRIDGGRISSRWGRVVWPRYRVMWLTRGIVGYTGRRVGRGVTMSTWNKGMILRITSKCSTCSSTVQLELTKITTTWSLERFKLVLHLLYIITARKWSFYTSCFYTCLWFCSQGGQPPPPPPDKTRRPLQWTVRILLECILVLLNFCRSISYWPEL